MKIINRMALGVASSLLLSAGLSRAAQKLDPLTKSIGPSNPKDRFEGTANNCSMPCFYQAESS
jgi:hypothetical protein